MADTSQNLEKQGLFQREEGDLTVLSTRLRVSEERYGDLRRKLQLIEQNMLAHQKKAAMDSKNAQSDLLEIKKTVRVMEDRIIM
ncbi:MAG: hypothetical protein AABY01_00595, partial [Nanoarchaeota archaeon]